MFRRALLLAVPLTLALTGCRTESPSAPASEELAQATPTPPPPPPETERRVVLERGDVLGAVVRNAGLEAEDAEGLLKALTSAFDPRKARPGHALVLVEQEGQLLRAAYVLGRLDAIDLTRDEEGWTAAARDVELVTEAATVSVTIESSLYEGFVRAGEDPALAVAASEVLAWEMDFYRDVRVGDRIDLMVEKKTHEGEVVGYGDILALRYQGGVGVKELFRYEHDGRAGYYTADGRSAKRAFLKQPLPLVRITSRYGGRMHPTLGYYKKHEGVDYGAPTGTPVWAVGDGVVTWAGYKGANGNLISIRHSNGYTSHYAHLSKVLVKTGQRVNQKQVIGHVGSTGRSTGPHLHFALSRGGKMVNPLTQNFPSGDPLPKAVMAEFSARITPHQDQLSQLSSLVASAEQAPSEAAGN